MRISVYFTLAFQRMTMSQMQVIVFSYLLPTHMYLALYSWPIYVYVHRSTSTWIITYDPWRLINTGQKPQLIRYANTQSHSYHLGFTLNHTSKYNCFHSALPLTTSYETYCIGLTADTDSATTSIFAQAHNFNRLWARCSQLISKTSNPKNGFFQLLFLTTDKRWYH